MEWLKSLAPTLATALGGPLAGAAVATIGKAFGWDDATKDKIEKVIRSGQMSGEQLAALQQAEIEFKTRMAELDIDVERIAAADRESARKMQIETKSYMPGILAVMITVGFFGILVGMMTGTYSPENNEALLILLGALGASWGAVVNFYFGSSKGSADKSAMLARAKQ